MPPPCTVHLAVSQSEPTTAHGDTQHPSHASMAQKSCTCPIHVSPSSPNTVHTSLHWTTLPCAYALFAKRTWHPRMKGHAFKKEFNAFADGCLVLIRLGLSTECRPKS